MLLTQTVTGVTASAIFSVSQGYRQETPSETDVGCLDNEHNAYRLQP